MLVAEVEIKVEKRAPRVLANRAGVDPEMPEALFLAFLIANCSKPVPEINEWTTKPSREASRVKELGAAWSPLDPDDFNLSTQVYKPALGLLQYVCTEVSWDGTFLDKVGQAMQA